MTYSLKAGFIMTKKDLFQATRGHYDFVIVFTFGRMNYQKTLIITDFVAAVDFHTTRRMRRGQF